MRDQGMPVTSLKAAKEWRDQNIDRSKDPRPIAVNYDLSEARAKREHHEAQLAEMREAREAGVLVERDSVVKAAADAGALIRQTLERLPTQLAPLLAAESDEHAIRARLEAAFSDVLADLEAGLRKL